MSFYGTHSVGKYPEYKICQGDEKCGQSQLCLLPKLDDHFGRRVWCMIDAGWVFYMRDQSGLDRHTDEPHCCLFFVAIDNADRYVSNENS